jgi:hypothetical protein
MASRYGVTIAQVRAASGIAESLIDDTDMQQLIDSAEYEVDRILNSKFVPTTTMELREGNNSERIVLKHNPVTKIRALEVDTTTIDVNNVRFQDQGGVLWLESEADKNIFIQKHGHRLLAKIKYDYAQMDETSTQTVTSADASAGTSVSLEVADSTGFLVGEYVKIEGFDGLREISTITDIPDGTHIEVDDITTDHESGSLVVEVIVPLLVVRFIQVTTALMGVARVVGSTFDEVTGYTAGEIQVQKGEPFTQWRETATQLRKEYDQILKSLRARPAVR